MAITTEPKRVRKPLTDAQRAAAREAHRRWMERNPEVSKASRRRANENYREKRSGWKEQNRAKIREYDREWYAANRERVKAVRRTWREQNRERLAAYWQAYRLKKAAPTASKNAEPGEARLRALSADALFAAASKAVPQGIKSWRREDIISEIVIAVLEGEIEASQIAAKAKDFIRDYNRRFSDFMNAEFNEAFHGASLDPAHDEGEMA